MTATAEAWQRRRRDRVVTAVAPPAPLPVESESGTDDSRKRVLECVDYYNKIGNALLKWNVQGGNFLDSSLHHGNAVKAFNAEFLSTLIEIRAIGVKESSTEREMMLFIQRLDNVIDRHGRLSSRDVDGLARSFLKVAAVLMQVESERRSSQPE